MESASIDLINFEVVQESSAFYYTNWQFPRLIFTKAKHVKWPLGFLSSFRHLVKPLHHGSRTKKGGFGVPMKRSDRGDFKRDMQNCCYVVGQSKRNRVIDWNTKYPEFCKQTHSMAKFLLKHTERLIPELNIDFAKVVSDANINCIPGTTVRASVISFDYESVYHLDNKDKHASILVVLKPDHIKGGWLVFPEWRLCFPMDNGDILIFFAKYDVHGTSEIYHIDDSGKVINHDEEKRIGYVVYT